MVMQHHKCTQHIAAVLNAGSIPEQLESLHFLKSWILPYAAAAGNNNIVHHGDGDGDFFEDIAILVHSQTNGSSENHEDSSDRDTRDAVTFAAHGDLSEFMWYVFDTRLGKKEAAQDVRQKQTLASLTVNCDGLEKRQLHALLDDFIAWFQCQDLSLEVLNTYITVIEKASQKPLVRKQTLNLATDWLKGQVLVEIAEEHFLKMKELLLLGLQDVWSAIRSMVVSRLGAIIESFSLDQLECLFSELAKVCDSPESSWQAKEGAIMAVNTVVRRFQWIGVEPSELNSIIEDAQPASPRTKYFLKFGQSELPGLPKYMTTQMKKMVFLLLAHPQLTVRENATKAFSSYLSRCEFKEALVAFKDIVTQLCRGIDYDTSKKFPHLAVLDPKFKFMDAYEAEGLLGVCVCLVKHIPPGFLLPNWPLYFSAFTLYLMHPASTVRQVASDIFKFLVAKDSHNPVILKLVLEGLSKDWNVTSESLSAPCNRAVSPAMQQPTTEMGRLMEKKILGVTVSRTTQPRTSITKVATSKKGNHGEMSSAWEWREGRLFAYEVILQFLIKNHIIYTFGSLNTGPDSGMRNYPAASPAMSADEALLAREKRWMTSRQQTTQSFGGISFKTELHRTWSEKGDKLNRREKLPRVPTFSKTSCAATNGYHACDSYNSDDDVLISSEEDEQIKMRLYGKRKKRYSISSCSSSHEQPIRFHRRLHTDSRRRAWSQSDRSSCVQPSPGVGESPTAKLYARLPTVAGFNSPSLKTLVKHYSYYTQNNAPFTAPVSPSLVGKAASLLMHTLAHDVQQANVTVVNKPMAALKNEMTSSSKDKEKLRSCLCPSPIGEAEEPAWLETIDLCPLKEILRHILYQTIESIADTQWELRRMGQQMLPCVVEVIRWYDMKVLEELWVEHLRPTTSLACYGACLALKYSMEHAAQLLPMLENPPNTWQDQGLCRQVVLRITHYFCESLPQLSMVIHGLLLRPCFDKLSITSLDILMIAHTHFEMPVQQRAVQVGSMVSMIRKLFIIAHAESSLSSHLKKKWKEHEFLTPIEGFLSCIPLKADGVRSCARQVEKAMLNVIHSRLASFIDKCQLRDISQLLPILAFYTGHYIDMDTFLKDILDAMTSLVNLVERDKKDLPVNDVEENCILGLKELELLIRLKTVDLTSLRQVLELYTHLCIILIDKDQLKSLLEAVAARLSNGSSTALPVYQVGSHEAGPTPVSAIPQSETHSSETDEDELDFPADGLAESQMMNLSGLSSSSRTSGRHNSARDGRLSEGGEDGEGESDWDSWDEDDEQQDQEVLRQMFVEFLQRLESHHNCNGQQWFTKTYKQLGMREQKIIAGLLNWKH